MRYARVVTSVVGTGLIWAVTVIPSRSQESRLPAAPRDPVAAILEAFRSYQLVALGDDHGNEQIHAFRLALIRDPRFVATVDDIVVEFGTARYQDAMDRFVSGEDVPYGALRRAWQDTTQPEYAWDLPIYEEFFRAVRAANAALPPARKVRVLLGDPPIDWELVPRLGLDHWAADRDRHAANVIRREVLEKGRRALVIYGSGHLARRNTAIGAADLWSDGLVGQLERTGIAKVFTIIPETHRDLRAVHPAAATWPIPSLALLRGTDVGNVATMSGSQQRPVAMEEQFDAVLYLGPVSAMTEAKLSRALCADRQYLEMRLTRLAMIPPPPGALSTPAARLKEYCATPDANAEIADDEPQLTAVLQATIRGAAAGTVDPAHITPESRERLVPLLQQIGSRFLQPAGPLQALVLLADSRDQGVRLRRYRAVFANGQKVLCTVRFSAAGTIMALDPRPE
jgi:hypothetical protein